MKAHWAYNAFEGLCLKLDGPGVLTFLETSRSLPFGRRLPVERGLGKGMAKVRCQRIGCDAYFSDEENPEDSCRYHDSPIFHDGMKEWSCCKKRSHDFSEFLAIPGCKTGKHTSEKPLTKAVTANRTQTPVVTPSPGNSTSAKESCSRCRHGFFCSDHGSGAKPVSAVPMTVSSPEEKKDVQDYLLPRKKVIDINEPQTCKNKGCGETFKEKDNHDGACCYHPGPAIFHDRMRGWKCCDVHVKEFDEFMEIPPCTKGWHNADPS